MILMAIRIIGQQTNVKAVDANLLVNTIEKNRDRVRTLANMVLSSSSVLISASLAFLLYLGNNKILDRTSAITIIVCLAVLLSASVSSIGAGLMRTKYVISDQGQFVESLLKLLSSELKVTYAAIGLLLCGAVTLVSAIVRVVLIRS